MDTEQTVLGQQLEEAEIQQSAPETSPSAAEDGDESSEESADNAPLLGFKEVPRQATLSGAVRSLRQAEWVVFTGRYPYMFDAVRHGFTIGHREDSSYQWTPDEVELPVHFLDNDYENADVERFTKRVFSLEPEIAVLGDIYDSSDLDGILRAGEEIWGSYPDMKLILVPKCREVLEDIPSDYILGFPNGKSDIQALDVATYSTWRSLPHQLHILGGTPDKTYEHITNLTRPTITGESPADIAGLDWNGYTRYAQEWGDYFGATGGWLSNLREGYHPTRDLVHYSLINAKQYWISRGVWPTEADLLAQEDLLRALWLTKSTAETTNRDIRELILSPTGRNSREGHGLFRTDQTQVRVMEPVAPDAALSMNTSPESEWVPAGECSRTATYDSEYPGYFDRHCSGCGRHISECHSESPPEMQIVYYDRANRTGAEHYQSVAGSGPDSLEEGRGFANSKIAVEVFCSEDCQKRAEYHDAHRLSPNDTDQFPDVIHQEQLSATATGKSSHHQGKAQ